MHALAADQPEIAVPVLSRSPLLLEDDLVDLIATGHPEAQTGDRQPRLVAALAGRRHRRSRLARRLALRFWKIPTPISRSSPIDRIVERFGHLVGDPRDSAGA